MYKNIQTLEKLNEDILVDLKKNAMLVVNTHLYEIWDFNKNGSIGLDIYKVTKGSDKIAWWLCPKCGSSYSARIQHKDRGHGCPICSGKRISKSNNLATKRPDLLLIWNYDKNTLNPEEVTVGTHKEVWWNCSVCEDTYPMSLNKKTRGRGCSICSGYYTTKKNSFGGKFPELAKEWHPTKNGDLTPFDVSYGSGKKIWWKCALCDSDYTATVDKKTSKNKTDGRCSICSSGLSFGEKMIYELLMSHSVEFIREFKTEWSKNKKYDFYLPQHNAIIEVHGEQHYRGTFERAGGRTLKQEQENDRAKEKLARENGIEHYIILKSIRMNIDLLVQDIKNSVLLELLEIEKDGFSLDTKQYVNDTIKIKTWDSYNNGVSIAEIAKEMRMDRSTIRRYISLGKKIGKCLE